MLSTVDGLVSSTISIPNFDSPAAGRAVHTWQIVKWEAAAGLLHDELWLTDEADRHYTVGGIFAPAEQKIWTDFREVQRHMAAEYAARDAAQLFSAVGFLD